MNPRYLFVFLVACCMVAALVKNAGTVDATPAVAPQHCGR